MGKARIEQPTLKQSGEFLSAVRRSRILHRGWVSPPGDLQGYARYVKSLARIDRRGFLVVTDGGAIAGVINVSEIVRGNFQSAYLGYYAFQPFGGCGLMRQGLQLVVSVCFGRLKLHRLEANIRPENARSLALVEGLGFRLEGYSPRYLKVCGRWRDHQRWALLAEDWRGQARTAHRGSARRKTRTDVTVEERPRLSART